MTKLEIAGLYKTRGQSPVLRDISLTIEPGGFCVIVGPSGCGKSTLLRLIAGLDAADAGTIRFDGESIDRLPAQARNVGLVFQNYALYPHMSVYDNLSYGLRIRGHSKAESRRRVAQAADMLQLGALLERRPHQLSGGQQQRVAIGRAIIREPRILLFDEPLSNLDAKLRAEMRLEIRNLHRRTGTTTLFVTHDQSEALTLADHLVVMADGAVAQAGPPRTLYERPASTFVGSFLGEPPMNFLAARRGAGGRLFLDDGTQLPLSVGDGPQALCLGIRPEHIRADAGGLPVDVLAIEDFGYRKIVHASLAGQRLAFVMADGDIQPGGRIGLRWDASDCLLFDAVRGVRLAAAVCPVPAACDPV